MDSELLSLLRCPRCWSGELELTGDPPSVIVCRVCSASMPVVDGIPRMAGERDSYAASFGRQWNRYDVARPEEDEATFRVKTGVLPTELAGRLVLDAGCGGGRYARLVGSHGAKLIGVDLSAAVVKAATLCETLPNVMILQADLLELPVADSAFDLVYSIGVLHHTPDPRARFRTDRPQGQARRAPGGLALSPQYVSSRMAQLRSSRSHHAATHAGPRTHVRGPGRARKHPDRESHAEQGRKLFRPSRLDARGSATTSTGMRQGISHTTPSKS